MLAVILVSHFNCLFCFLPFIFPFFGGEGGGGSCYFVVVFVHYASDLTNHYPLSEIIICILSHENVSV